MGGGEERERKKKGGKAKSVGKHQQYKKFCLVFLIKPKDSGSVQSKIKPSSIPGNSPFPLPADFRHTSLLRS